MDVLAAIHHRRSVRRFLPDAVPAATVDELLAAAMAAPSAGNQQPWEFVVVDRRELLDAVATVNPYAEMCREAPLGILVCADPRREKFPGFWVQDCAAAVENLLLAATARGLGAVWTGIHPLAERVAGMRRLFALPGEIEPLAFVVLGLPASEPLPAPDRFDLGRVHRNRW